MAVIILRICKIVFKMATLEMQYENYVSKLEQFERALSFEEWRSNYGTEVLRSMEALQTKKLDDNIEHKFDELIKFLEYEEAMTVDTRSQQRITTKLIELGIWPNR